MKYGFYIIFFLMLTGAISCRNNKDQTTLVPVEDFFRNPEKSNMSLSPNGSHIAYLQNYNSRSNLFIQNLSTEKTSQLTFDTVRGISKYLWLDNDQLLYLFDTDGKENYHLFSIDLRTGKKLDLTPFKKKIKMRILDNPVVGSDDIFISLNDRDPGVFDLYSLNCKTGKLSLIEKNPGNISYWKEDLKGQIRLAVTTDGVNEKILFRKSIKEPFKEVISLNFKETLYPICFTRDGNAIYAISNLGRDKTALVIFDLITAKERSVVFENDEVDVQSMSYSYKTFEPMFATYTTSKHRTEFLNDTLKKISRRVEKLIRSKDFSIVSFSTNDDRFIVKSYSDKNLGTYYLYDVSEDKVKEICNTSPWLDNSKLADMKPINFKSRDGLNIHGYLTLPNENLDQYPLVVIPHGGPWSRNRWGFNPEVQFLANRGYAVLQVNYRGSEGYGKAFMQAGFREIGKGMQNDITDGVQYLISKGIIDTARIGIFGFSFGGYFALNGLMKDSGLYKCAISYCGITNLFAYIKEIPPHYHQYLQMFYEMIGNPERDAEYFRDYSPAFHTDKMNVPLFIAHGENDQRVSAEEVSVFVKNIKKTNPNINYMLLKDEGHGFKKQENKFALYHEMESFLEMNLLNR